MIVLGITLVAIIAIAGCGAAGPYNTKSDMAVMESSAARDIAPIQYTSYDGEYEETGQQESGEVRERKLIENISMTLVVVDVPTAFQTIREITLEMSGFVEDSRNWQANQTQRGYLTVRIPTERLAQAVKGIESLGEVSDSHTNTQDVTERYFDREARLRNLEKQEERYLEILSEAKTTEDILNVERELVRIREQIEVLKGQLTYMDHQVQYATIHIQLQEEKTISEYARPSFKKAFDASGVAVQNSITIILTAMTLVIIAGGYVLPLSPVIILVGYMIYRKLYSKRNKVSNGIDEIKDKN